MEWEIAWLLAAALGLLGFIEPCSVGSHLVFLKYLDACSPADRFVQTVLFALTRSGLMALLGAVAVILGAAFTGLQQGLWIVLGVFIALVGALYMGGGVRRVMAPLNRILPPVSTTTGSVGLGLAFGLNIPACAAPILAWLLGGTVAQASAGTGLLYGTSTLLIFGLALSSPLLLAVYTHRGRRWLDALARWAGRMPRWSGGILVVLGLWSIAQAF